MSISRRYYDLVSLFPRFLRLQPFGWKGSQGILESGLQLLALLLLRALVQETDPGEMLSRQEMASRGFNPYSTFHPIFDNLPSLLEMGYLSQSSGRYLVTPRGRSLIERIEQASQDYTATLTPMPLPDLTRLAGQRANSKSSPGSLSPTAPDRHTRPYGSAGSGRLRTLDGA